MAYMYVRTLTAGRNPYRREELYHAEIGAWTDFDIAFCREHAVRLMQAAFSQKGPGELDDPSELYFNQLFVRHPETGEKLFVENMGDFRFLQIIHPWWSGEGEALAPMAVAAAFCDVPAEGFIRLGTQNFHMEHVAVIQSDRGYAGLEDSGDDMDVERLFCLYETYHCGTFYDALLKEYPLNPEDPASGTFLGYAPERMPECTLEMWAARQALMELPAWNRLTLFAPVREGAASEVEIAPEEEDVPPVSASAGEEKREAETPPAGKKYARVRYDSFSAFARNVRPSYREALPLLRDVLEAFSGMFPRGVEFDFRKNAVAVIIANNKSRVRNLVNLSLEKDGRVEMKSEPLGLELSLGSVEDISHPHWQMIVAYFNEHSEDRVDGMSRH